MVGIKLPKMVIYKPSLGINSLTLLVIQITMFFTVLCSDYFNVLAVIGKLSFPMMKENPSMFIYIVVNMNDWNKIFILKGNVKTVIEN